MEGNECRYVYTTTNVLVLRISPGLASKVTTQVFRNSKLRVVEIIKWNAINETYNHHNMENNSDYDSNCWLNAGIGWFQAVDMHGTQNVSEISKEEAELTWAKEYETNRQIACKITNILMDHLSLGKAKYAAEKLTNACTSFLQQSRSLIVRFEIAPSQLLISLDSMKAQRTSELFQIIKLAACQHSDPFQSLKQVSDGVLLLANLRPTSWENNGYSVLKTTSQRTRIDKFVEAAASGDVDQLQSLFETSFALMSTSDMHSMLDYTALHAAAEFGRSNAVEWLIANAYKTPQDINISDRKSGYTPLHYAAQHGRIDIVNRLLERNADKHIKSLTGVTASTLAETEGQMEARQLCLDPPPRVDDITCVSSSPTTILVSWIPPLMHRQTHSTITRYIVFCTPAVRKMATQSSRPATPLSSFPNSLRRLVSSVSVLAQANDQSIEVRGLQPALPYSCSVQADSAGGIGMKSNEILCFTSSSVPQSPGMPQMVCRTPTSIMLIWTWPESDNGCDLEEFQVIVYHGEEERELRRLSVFRTIIHQEDSVSGDTAELKCHLNVSQLDAYTGYRFSIRCRNKFGWSDESVKSDLYETNFPFKIIQIAARSIEISWTSPVLDHHSHKCTGYEVCQRNLDSDPFTYLITVNSNSALVSDLTPAHQIQLKVFPIINECSDMQYLQYFGSTSEVMRTLADCPSRPCQLEISEPSSTTLKCSSVSLTWKSGLCNGSPIAAVSINYKRFGQEIDDTCSEWKNVRMGNEFDVDDSNGTNQITGTISIHNQVEISGLRSNEFYCFKLSEVNKIGKSDWSDELTIQTRSCESPRNVSVKSIGTSFLEIEWENPRDSYLFSVHEFIIQWMEDEENVFGNDSANDQWQCQSLIPTSADIRSHNSIIQNLKPSIRYRVRVGSRTIVGLSAFSDFVLATCEARF